MTWATALIGLCPILGVADSPRKPSARVIASDSGRFLLKLIPSTYKREDDLNSVDRDSYGIAYEVIENGELKEIWRAEDCYTWNGFLSWDGKTFIRMGPWASDRLLFKDLAVAFYHEGTLIESYEVRDLLKDPSRASRSVSHYDWLSSKGRNLWFDPDNNNLTLTTADGITYQFSCPTGSVVSMERDRPHSAPEVLKYGAGRNIWESSESRERLEVAYDFSEVWLDYLPKGKHSGDGPALRLEFKPKKSYQIPVFIEAEWRIFNHEIVLPTYKPEDVTSAIEGLLKHPFFTQTGIQEIPLRIKAGPMALHLDTRKLIDYLDNLENVTGEHPIGEADVRGWVELQFDQEYIAPFYFHPESGKVVTGVMDGYPREVGAEMIDSKGNRTRADFPKHRLEKEPPW
jgi:hypothetical protein